MIEVDNVERLETRNGAPEFGLDLVLIVGRSGKNRCLFRAGSNLDFGHVAFCNLVEGIVLVVLLSNVVARDLQQSVSVVRFGPHEEDTPRNFGITRHL